VSTSRITVRLPDHLLAQVDALVPDRHPSRSDALRRALELYLYRVACARDAGVYARVPPTEAERSMGDNARDWKATPAW